VGRIPRGGLVDRKQRSNIGAAVPTSLTGELRLEVGQPDIIRPLAGIDHYRMRALVVAAVDEKPGRARRPHFPESDFRFAWHGCNFAKNRPHFELAIPGGKPTGCWARRMSSGNVVRRASLLLLDRDPGWFEILSSPAPRPLLGRALCTKSLWKGGGQALQI